MEEAGLPWMVHSLEFMLDC